MPVISPALGRIDGGWLFMNSKTRSFLPIFQALRAKCSEGYELPGDRLIVEKVVMDDFVTKRLTTAEGKQIELIVGSSTNNRVSGGNMHLANAICVRVLDVGRGYYKEDGTTEPLELEVGDILMVTGIESVRWWTNAFGLMQIGENTLGAMQADQYIMRWRGQAAFDSFMAVAREGFDAMKESA